MSRIFPCSPRTITATSAADISLIASGDTEYGERGQFSISAGRSGGGGSVALAMIAGRSALSSEQAPHSIDIKARASKALKRIGVVLLLLPRGLVLGRALAVVHSDSFERVELLS